MPPILICETLDPRAADWLTQRARVVWHKHDEPGFDAALADAEGLVVRTYTIVSDQLLDRAPKLKVVGRAGAGLDNIDAAACRKRSVQVVYTPDANTQAVVEYMLGLMLDHHRPRTDLPAGSLPDQFHALRKTEVGTQLDQLTLGILGFGRIGKKLGRAAHAIGMNLRACDLLPEVELRKAVAYPFEFVDHDTLYATSDVLAVHVDGRPENKHLVNRDMLAKLKPNVLLINAARGMLVDSHALAAWANDHPDAHAVLDVHDPEPPPAPGSYPLWNLPNVRLLPHLASRTDTAMLNMSWVVRDVLAVLEGRAPQYPAP